MITLDVYLLPGRGEGFFLHAKLPEPEPPPATEEPETASSKTWKLAKETFEEVARRFRRRELLLRELGEIERARVHHPSSLTEAEARGVYRELIGVETRKHRKWLAVDAAALPVSVPLSLVPGPNVLLAYLAWRTVAHYRAKKAGERAEKFEVTFVPDDALTELAEAVRGLPRFGFGSKRRIREIGARLGVKDLDRLY